MQRNTQQLISRANTNIRHICIDGSSIATGGSIYDVMQGTGISEAFRGSPHPPSTHPVTVQPQLRMLEFHLFLPRPEVDHAPILAKDLGYHTNPPPIVAEGIDLIK
jgi:hypothetical protein